jgi:hypothetical protein
MRMPSDLAGLTTAEYDWPRKDRSYKAAVGPACDSIRDIIRSLGPSENRMGPQIRAVQDEQVRQKADLQNILRFLVENFVTDHELTHLRKLETGAPFPFQKSDAFEGELRRLLSLGLLARKPGHGIRSLFKDGDDVRNHLEITDRGRAYLTNLAQMGRAD